MKIKNWVNAIEDISHCNEVVGEVRYFEGVYFYTIVMAQDEDSDKYYYLPNSI
jgi:hypothetical protein